MTGEKYKNTQARFSSTLGLLLGSEFKSTTEVSASEAEWRIWRDDWEGGGIGGGKSAVEDCEARRDCSVKRRDEI